MTGVGIFECLKSDVCFVRQMSHHILGSLG